MLFISCAQTKHSASSVSSISPSFPVPPYISVICEECHHITSGWRRSRIIVNGFVRKSRGYLLPSTHQYPFMGVSMTGRWNTGCQSQSAHIIFFPNIIGKISLNSIWLNTLQPKPAVTPLNHQHTAPKPTDS